MLCNCGCNRKTKEENKFILGHNTKINPPMRNLATAKRNADIRRGKPIYKNRGRKTSDETKEKIRISKLGIRNPNFNKSPSKQTIEKMKESLQKASKRPEAIEKRRKIMLKRWRNPDDAAKMFKNLDIRPNKLELRFKNFLDENFPNEWKYVGDGYTWIAGKNPDFMNINGKKQLIELYGNYWHRDDNPQDRIDHFKKYGFDTLIVWEEELKDTNKLLQTVKNLCYNRRL
jgi:G:T-mismatch repair DNA endonuclease (very short patch repair protein)